MRETAITVVYKFDRSNVYNVDSVITLYDGINEDLRLYDIDDTLKMSVPYLRSSTVAGRSVVFKENHPMFNINILLLSEWHMYKHTILYFLRNYLFEILKIKL